MKNAGRTLAPPASVTLRVGDRLLPPAVAPSAAPGATRRVAFTAPACAAGEELEVTVDPGDVLDEADEDNVLVVPCPPPDRRASRRRHLLVDPGHLPRGRHRVEEVRGLR